MNTPVKAGRSKRSKAIKQLTPAELFFYDNAGYSYKVGESPESGRIRCAKELAKAEARAEELDFSFDWDYDSDIPYEDALGDHEYWCKDAEQGQDHTHEILWCQLWSGEQQRCLASLGAIIDPSPEYRRVVEAELAGSDPPPKRRSVGESEKEYKMRVTFGQLLDDGLWERFCEITGTSPWCMNEGLASSDEEVWLSPEQICQLYGCKVRKPDTRVTKDI